MGVDWIGLYDGTGACGMVGGHVSKYNVGFYVLGFSLILFR